MAEAGMKTVRTLLAAIVVAAGGMIVVAPALRAAPPPAETADTAYQFTFEGLMTDALPLSAFSGKVILVVNTASQCGYTPQYAGLQRLYDAYRARGLVIVGVPSNDFGGQEPGSAVEIRRFCKANYGVTFPMAAKYDVIGPHAHPFYQWAAAKLGPSARPQWNFHKILIDRAGRPIAAYPSQVPPEDLRPVIEKALAAAG